MKELPSGVVDTTPIWVDNQTVAGIKRAIDIDAVPYQDRGQGHPKLFRDRREVIAGLNDVDPLLPLLAPFLVDLVETLLKIKWRVFWDG